MSALGHSDKPEGPEIGVFFIMKKCIIFEKKVPEKVYECWQTRYNLIVRKNKIYPKREVSK